MRMYLKSAALYLLVLLIASCSGKTGEEIEAGGYDESKLVTIPDLNFSDSSTPAGQLDRVEYYNYAGSIPDTALFSTRKLQLFYDEHARVKGVSTSTYTVHDNRTMENVTERSAYKYSDGRLHRVFTPIATNGANAPHQYGMLEYMYNAGGQATHILYYVVDRQGNAVLVKENSTALSYNSAGRLIKEEKMGSKHTIIYTWEGSNVKTRTEGFPDGSYSGTNQYQYDTQPSILKLPYGVSETMHLYQPGVASISDNNIISSEGRDAIRFTNEYDANSRLIQRGINLSEEAPIIQKFIFKQ